MVYRVGVAGASGYAGGELVRLLSAHPGVDVAVVSAYSQAGSKVTDAHPHLRSMKDVRFVPTTAEAFVDLDVVFFALPHGQSAQLASEVAALNPSALLVDCGADHRLESARDWDEFYGGDFISNWTYGVPELPAPQGRQRERLIGTRRIAAPGCNASSVALGLAPGIQAGLIEPQDTVATLAVGPSGAGRALRPHLLASELLGNVRPYSVAGVHRHIPEIKQAASWAHENGSSGQDFQFALSFTPVLIPVARGILASISVPVKDGVTEEQLVEAWSDWYADEPFVQVLPLGEMPQLSDVIGANTALIGVALDSGAGRALIIVAVDNLVKGTAGAAIQSMNIALGLEESLGLTTNGVAP